MTRDPPLRAMRANPDLDQLKRQAKELLDAFRARMPEALTEVGFYDRRATPETFALHDAQLVLARAYGFASWPKLKAAVDGATAARLHDAVEGGDAAAARALLERRPEIVAPRAAVVSTSCSSRSSASTGHATIRAGSGCCGGRCPVTWI